MTNGTAFTLSLAAVLVLSPSLARTQNTASRQSPQTNATMPRGEHEALRMVSARTALHEDIDADKAQPGTPIRAVLRKSVQLTNGPELPAGTVIEGMVGKDDMNLDGRTKLALCFTKAELKSGQIIPIKATIMGIYGPESIDDQGNPVAAGGQEHNVWNDKSVGVDEIGALDGVDLHSRISSKDSGVLVAKKKGDVKLKRGSEIAMAIAPQPQQAAGSGAY